MGLIAQYDVPGVQVAFLADGEIQGKTTDEVFRVGSITKLWTATLVQQLVDEGVLDLDQPVRRHLPTCGPALTARHLLTHMGGIALSTEDQVVPPGTVLSYSNSGFAVLARLVEAVGGRPFDDVLHERLVEPLGLRSVVTGVGHGTAPGASDIAMNARELLEFVRLHLDDPKLAVLREVQVENVPDFGGGVVGWGLGWMLYRDGVVGHTGVAKGHKAYLRVVPESGTAVAVLTDCANSEMLAYEVFTGLLKDVTTEAPPTPAENPGSIDAARMCGTYRNQWYDITLEEEALIYQPRTDLGQQKRVEVVRHGDSSVITVEPTNGGHQVFSLVGEDEEGRARFLHNGSVAYRV
ncbi:serine hydrolase [Lentzea pudingi]|uniref:Serine hydrolase n=1 Tax=Lentzea pudingi TaxID=1789439 RepID=A0ABQ2IPY7_9PSEU|nr:serine hydrolase domain-containing protein [Lentzea pudingi]GGN18613.1 serine hydrolase [Lentzea pudingi]